MAEHGVVLFGCDVDTAVIIDLDEYEAQALLRVQEKVNEVARMLAGEQITDLSKKHAEEMVSMAEQSV